MATLAAAADFLARVEGVSDAGIGLLVVDADGTVMASCGNPGTTPAIGAAWDAAAIPAGTEAVVCPVDSDSSIVCLLPGSAPAEVRAVVEALVFAAAEVARLEGDMDSMNSSSLALLEHVAMVDELVSRLPSCDTDDEVVRLGIEKLLVAASVRHVAYVGWDERTGRASTRFVLDVDPTGRLRGSAGLRPFDPAVSLVGEILLGDRDVILETVPDGARLGAPGLPEWDAEREFLAVPVRFGDGVSERTVGAIVVADKQANRYSSGETMGSQEVKLAATLARVVGSAIGSRRVAAIGRELGLAREIQQQILPEGAAVVAGFELAGRCETSGAVGGDYYDFVPMADGRTMALVADVSGHNLASGMLMVAARTALRLLAGRLSAAGDVVSGVGDALGGDLARTERFISVAGVAIRPEDPTVEVVNAGHVDVLVHRAAGGVVERFASTDTVLGFMAGIRYESVVLHLGPGDVMLLYTDGVVEALGARDEMFGDRRLEEVLVRAGGAGAAAVMDAVFDAVSAFAIKGHGGDDVTVVVVRRKDGSEEGSA